MPESVTKLPVRQETATPAARRTSLWEPFESLHKEVDRIFDDFMSGFGRRALSRRAFEAEPLLRNETSFGVSAPVVDVVEKEKDTRSRLSCRAWRRRMSRSALPTTC